MAPDITDLFHQAWRVLLIVLVPAFIIPVVGGGASLMMALFGVRDEGLAYASRVVAMVGVGALFLSRCVDSLIELMRMALS